METVRDGTTEDTPSRAFVRVGLHQAEPGSGIRDDERAMYREAGIEILVLPEYFWVRALDRTHRDAADHLEDDLEYLGRFSREENLVVVGGTVVESHGGQHFNACPVFMNGKELGRYRKIHLMPGEEQNGISPGEEFLVLDALGLSIAPVICADVLHPGTFDHIGSLQPDLVLAPMSSPFRPDDTEQDKESRDREIFVRGAAAGGATIVKAGGMGSLFGRPLQGRCLVATPNEILFRTPFDQELERRCWVVDVPVSR